MIDEAKPSAEVVLCNEHAATRRATIDGITHYSDVNRSHLASITPGWRPKGEKLRNQADDELPIVGSTIADAHPQRITGRRCGLHRVSILLPSLGDKAHGYAARSL